MGGAEAGSGKGKKPIIIVQGGQWGSEAKGLVAQKLTNVKKVDAAIRTGTVNAGHTIWYEGKQYKMQQLPVSWVRPECMLVLGPGAYIHPEILEREIGWINDAIPGQDVRDRLLIDFNCGLHTPEHTERARIDNRHAKIGATGKGCSQAVVDKILGRGNGGRLFADQYRMAPAWSHCFADTVRTINEWFDNGDQLLIEGTQGTMLDLHLGPYPYTTHKQTQAASWMAEAGLSCTLPTDLWLVMRTFPIRVAGNSGPLPNEITWAELAREVGRPEEEIAERTTVTNKIRRIARWDWYQARESVMLNRPHHIALTFINYVFPKLWGYKVGDPFDVPDGFHKYMSRIWELAPVDIASYGPLEENTVISEDL